MKITVNEQSEIILKEVYNGIGLESNSGEQFSICTRDSGFEFSYGNKRYKAKNGDIEILGCVKPCGMNYCNENNQKDQNNMKIEYISEDKSVLYSIEFITGHPLNYTHKGKSWDRKTQAILKYNGFVESIYSVTKHYKDPDNLKLAIIKCAKEVMKQVSLKDAKINLWNQILNMKVN